MQFDEHTMERELIDSVIDIEMWRHNFHLRHQEIDFLGILDD